jgi:hypothetical protein
MLDKNAMEKEDSPFNIDLGKTEGELICPRCQHKQVRKRRTVCEACKHYIADTGARSGWNPDPKKMYAGMEEIFSDENENAPQIQLKASRRSSDWKRTIRNGVIFLFLAALVFYALKFSYKYTLGQKNWTKVQQTIISGTPVEIRPYVKSLME